MIIETGNGLLRQYPFESCDCCGYVLVCNLKEKEYASTQLEGNLAVEEYMKRPEKVYHCRICGRHYYDKGESRECERSHDWQKRKGRR